MLATILISFLASSLAADLALEPGDSTEIASLRDTVNALKQEVSELKQLKERFNTLENELSPTNHARGRRVPSATQIAFSVVLSTDVTNVPTGNAIKYDTVLLNQGNGYNKLTGMFTAHVSGTYIISYHMGHHGNGESWLELKKDGVVINGVAEEGTAAGQNTQGGNTAILHLEAGDQVWVETFKVTSTFLHGLFTTFSGALLYEDEA